MRPLCSLCFLLMNVTLNVNLTPTPFYCGVWFQNRRIFHRILVVSCRKSICSTRPHKRTQKMKTTSVFIKITLWKYQASYDKRICT
ncbi:unnamed protein product, partial [Nesidiocoris tenuis]